MELALSTSLVHPCYGRVSDPILALFANGEQGAYYTPDTRSTLFQSSDGTTAVTADDDPVGYSEDGTGNGNNATQSTATARPLSVTIGGVTVLEPDFVNDVLTVPNALATGDLLIETPHGWMLSQDQHFGSTDFDLPLVWNSKTLVHQGLTPAQVASLGDSLRGDQQWGLFLSPDTVFNNLMFNGDGTAKTVRFVGANGAVFDQVFTSSAISPLDVAPEGLTAPVLMMLPIVLGESGSGSLILLSTNNLTGSIPDWSGWTSGTDIRLNSNNLTDVLGTSIPATVLDMQLYNNALTQVAVDRVLTSLDAAGGTGGLVKLEGGTNAVPSATGLTAKTNLESKGWTVTVNT